MKLAPTRMPSPLPLLSAVPSPPASTLPRSGKSQLFWAGKASRGPIENTEDKIKVTYVLGSLRDGGAERYALQIMQRLGRGRFDPSLILMEGVNLERSDGFVSERFVMNIPQAGNTRWMRRSLRLARAVKAAADRFREWNSDVVHAFLPGPSILGGAAAKLARVPVIIGSRHSLVSLYCPGRGVAALADRMAFHLADLSIAPSEAVAEEMLRLGGCRRGTAPRHRFGTSSSSRSRVCGRETEN